MATVARWWPTWDSPTLTPALWETWPGGMSWSRQKLTPIRSDPQLSMRNGSADLAGGAGGSPAVTERMGQFIGTYLPVGLMAGTFRSAWVCDLTYATGAGGAPRYLIVVARVFSSANVDRGVIFEGTSATTTTAAAHVLTVSGPITGEVVTQPGDYIVVDMGGYVPASGGIYQNQIMLKQYLYSGGYPSFADAPHVDQTLGAYVSWVELNLPDLFTPAKVNGAHAESLTTLPPTSARLSAENVGVLYNPPASAARISATQVQVLMPQVQALAQIQGMNVSVLIENLWVVSASDGTTPVLMLHEDGQWRPLYLGP